MAISAVEGQMNLRVHSQERRRKLKDLNFEDLTRKCMLLRNAWDGAFLDRQLELIMKFLDSDEHFLQDTLVAQSELSKSPRLRLTQLQALIVAIN